MTNIERGSVWLILLLTTTTQACLGGGDGGAGLDAAVPPPDMSPARWEEAFDTSQSAALFGVWGSAPDDVFIVGGDDTEAEIHHYDGDSWSRMPAPDVAALIWLHGFGPDDVYAVGIGGAVVHYDGNRWTKLDSGTEEDLWGIFGLRDDAMFVVGGDPEGEAPTLLRFDGERFEPMALEETENARDARALFKVWGIGDKLFALGQRGQILELVDGRWRNSPAGGQADQDWVSLWGTSQDNIVAVGGRSNARISHYDGTRWNSRGESGLGGLNAVHMTDASYATIGGVNGFVGRYEIEADEIVAEQQEITELDIHAMWSDGQGKTYAVAGDFLPPFEGAALVRTADRQER